MCILCSYGPRCLIQINEWMDGWIFAPFRPQKPRFNEALKLLITMPLPLCISKI